MTAKVEIYGTSNCRKCVDVRALLDRYSIEYVDHLIDLMPLEKDEMFRRCGLKHYPQIFINDEHIGGEEELMMLEADGRLRKLLGSRVQS
ncbi:glutaredoxin domain-containing protein [Thiocapsa bogorovii]|uniref:glutaredoxin domain-containing protein n=1 Tax=Thiocapsa bogorovii TaxID=521689 RepID=UPI001E4007A9|nr:glutaredoxin domain-containing protein [Thiocapsa bogorovii]UHD17581.1 glutaredoxin [Thiocapsa bogorovii]